VGAKIAVFWDTRPYYFVDQVQTLQAKGSSETPVALPFSKTTLHHFSQYLCDNLKYPAAD
jgi:hypothetical protein